MTEDARARIVQFWRVVEMFSPQQIPRVSGQQSKSATEIIVDLAPDEIAPWEEGHWIRQRALPRNKVWQFSVYGGIYELSRIRDVLIKEFGGDANEAFLKSGEGQSATFAFTLNKDGFLVRDSSALSACAWAIGQLRGRRTVATLDGFDVEERAFIAGLNRLVPQRPKTDSSAKTMVGRFGEVVRDQAKHAATDAISAGAKAAGEALRVTTAAAVGTVTGPIIGGVVGTVASTFASKLLTPRNSQESQGESGQRERQPPTDGRHVPPELMTAQVIHEFVASLGQALGVTDMLNVAGVRIKCVQVLDRDAEEAREQNFLNSFIADDLLCVEHAVRHGDIGMGAEAYLTSSYDIDIRQRVDVRSTPGAVIAGVAPRRIPGGRWPTDINKPLALSQQFAVNQGMADLDGGAGIFAVNGPPGTGKTTMLRDVIAAVVVDRACRLADLRLTSPLGAFDCPVERVALSGRYTATVRAVRPELTGSEIVVATAGNKAAENITAEIPGIGAVSGAEEEAVAADYFTELACDVLGTKAWALITARLGKRSHRQQFAKRFWWGDLPEVHGQQADPSDGERPRGMMKILKKAAQEPATADDWAAAVGRFNKVRSYVERLGAERQRLADGLGRLAELESQVTDLDAKATAARASCDEMHIRIDRTMADLDYCASLVNQLNGEIAQHAQLRPGFWVSLSTGFRAGRRWQARNEHLADQRARMQADLESISRALDQQRSVMANAITEREAWVEALSRTLHEVEALRLRVDSGWQKWPNAVPSPRYYSSDEQFQLCTPWADPEFTAARNLLFLEALRLHKAFILGAASRIRGNLEVAMAVLQKDFSVQQRTLQTVWQTLFLVVPVVSTTFASLPRLFRGLNREVFGWLFIDEAGQATPQQALGGIWRARRSVIVGDPQQLEPIMTLPSIAQHAIRRNCRVDAEWTPEVTSAQRVADRLVRYGTSLPEPTGDARVWVGAPLRVHRRCERLMFDISNEIAYGGDLMVYGTRHTGDYPGQDCWIDVQSGQAQRNWVPAEGIELKRLLTELDEMEVPADQVRIVSPFRDVAREAHEIAGRHFGWSFARQNVGTIHTVQGQEADLVVIILGSAPSNCGARAWAAEKPNLLNVAVSRSKRRLYVIGNRAKWREQRYFDVLAARLPDSQ